MADILLTTFSNAFLTSNIGISMKMSLTFLPMCRLKNKRALVWIMSWFQIGGKLSSEQQSWFSWRIYSWLLKKFISVLIRRLNHLKLIAMALHLRWFLMTNINDVYSMFKLKLLRVRMDAICMAWQVLYCTQLISTARQFVHNDIAKICQSYLLMSMERLLLRSKPLSLSFKYDSFVWIMPLYK